MFRSCEAAQTKSIVTNRNPKAIIFINIFLQVEWQSEQERKESKSIYHSEKEDSYIPFIPKDIEDSHAKDELKDATISEKNTIDVNKVLSSGTKKDKSSTKNVTDKKKS